MDRFYSKPRVFLSHSSKDNDFIDNISSGLRRCQIEPWLDTEEIRHGKPWLDAIFKDGIPTCDAVFVYLSKFSIDSKMVQKEIDVGILQKLDDNNIAFLPYVSDEIIRSELRPDIQSLQTPVWNEANFAQLIPEVVAEIWRSFQERTIAFAIKDERVKRLEAELHLERIKNQHQGAIINPSENTEFQHIWGVFDNFVPIEFVEETREETDNSNKLKYVESRTFNLKVNLATIVALLAKFRNGEFHWDAPSWLVIEQAKEILNISSGPNSWNFSYKIDELPDIYEQLRIFGLLESVIIPPDDFSRSSRSKQIFSKKYYRFQYWLEYHDKMPKQVEVKVIN